MKHVMMRSLAAVVCAGLVIVATGVTAQQTAGMEARLERALDVPDTNLMKSHLRFLSSGLLEERIPGSTGALIAAQYVAAEFEALGLAPAGADGSFLQPFELLGIRATATLTVGARGQTITLEPGRDFVAWPERPADLIAADGELVFVGYGVRAPEQGRDDYQDAALIGQIVVILAGDAPQRGGTDAVGRSRALYGTWRYKLDQAARMGARGALLVCRDRDVWDQTVAAWGGERLFFDRPAENNLEFGAWITETAARRLLAASDRDFDLLARRAELPAFRPMPVGAHAVMQLRGTVRATRSLNVLARLPGTDPVVGQESVVLMAPYDNPAVASAIRGDDASGIAALLGAAAGLARGTAAPRRPVTFVATGATGVEHAGTRALADDPTMPLENIAAVVSVLGRVSEPGSARFVAPAADASDLGRFVELAARAEHDSVTLADRAGWFLRADHLPLALAGVPSTAVGVGASDGPSRAGAPNAPVDLVRQARLVMRLAFLIGQAHELPAWNPSSEFRPAGDRLEALRLRRPGAVPPKR